MDLLIALTSRLEASNIEALMQTVRVWIPLRLAKVRTHDGYCTDRVTVLIGLLY